MHDPGKVLMGVALAVVLGGDCLADVGMLRAESAMFGPVASGPTGSSLIDTLASARAEVREHVWKSAGLSAPDAAGQVNVIESAQDQEQGSLKGISEIYCFHISALSDSSVF